MEFNKIEGKKILIYGLANRGGGSKTFLIYLIRQLLSHNAEKAQYIAILPQNWASASGQFNDENLHCIFVEDVITSSVLKRLIYENFTLRKIIRKYQIDLLFIASEIIPFTLRSVNIPILINYHATVQLNKRYLRKINLRSIYNYIARIFSLNRTNGVVFVSQHSKAEITFKFYKLPIEKFFVIYHGVSKHDDNVAKRDITSSLNFSYILSVGDRYEHKNYKLLIQYYYELIKKYKLTEHLLIIGRSKSKSIDEGIREEVEKLNLSERVHLIDFVANDTIQHYYKNAVAYVSFSSIESFGMTPLEALSNSIPAIMMQDSALPEIYGRYSGFFDIKLNSKEEIINLMFMSVCDKNFREKLLTEGKALCNYYTWERCALNYKRLFERTLNI